jgi:hypothetical protein
LKKINEIQSEDKLLTYLRTKGKRKADKTLKDVYKHYIAVLEATYMPLDTPYNQTMYYMDYKQFKKIITIIFQKMVDEVVFKGKTFNFPYSMGELYMGKKKPVYKTKPKFIYKTERDDVEFTYPIDWVATKKLWMEDPEAKLKHTKVYNTNDHTNGYKYKIAWVKSKKTIYNRGILMYLFEVVRDVQRNKIAYALNNNLVDKENYFFLKAKKYRK